MKNSIRLKKEEARFIERLYKEFGKQMFAISARFTDNTMDREDIVSIALMALMKNAGTIKSLSFEQQKSYIAKTVISASVSFLRSKNTINSKEIPIEALETDLEQERGDEADERIILTSEMNAVLQMFSLLPYKERICLQLKFLGDKKDEEIAAITHLSTKSIPKYISRARKRLRALYNADEGEETDE